MMPGEIATLPLERAEDVFTLRQNGRVAAAVLGADQSQQVRFATALSELGREALARGTISSAVFALGDDGALLVSIERFPRIGGRIDATVIGIAAARKLVDDVNIVDGKTSSAVTVVLRHRLPAKQAVTAALVREALNRSTPPRALDELRLENRDLIATLSELKAQQDMLVHLNEELEETNRGVMAMYGQLADELEETNRGVVALYAELDDKTVRLNEANEAKTRFLANVSHELRSPVSSILALVRLLADPQSEALSSDQQKQLALVHSSGSELLGLVNQLLDLAKAESGRLDPDVGPVDLAALLGELRGSLRPLAKPGVLLEFDVAELPIVHTDGTLLNQVLRNLLTNALKFTRLGGVRLSARISVPHEVEIAVADTGIGIEPDDVAKVFEEFYQVRGPMQSEHKGTGLGLPYARRVTQILGGEITLESTPGEGSTFTVRIPTQWQPLLRAPESPGPQPRAPEHVKTVLVIDDDEGFRTALRGMLQGVASHVLEAGGGFEGLNLMRTAAPDLVFVDLWMPDLDGASVLAAMNAEPELRSIPAIIVTSAQLTATIRGTLGSAAAVLAKTNVDRAVVERTIAEALAVAGAAT